jgi:Malate synthase
MKFLKSILRLFKSSDDKTTEMSLKISPPLQDFVRNEMLPGLNISENYFWASLQNILNKFSKINEELLDKRKYLQNKIDNWHIDRRNKEFDIKGV